jgi:N6-adenosine-specific RNA methylase IME4
MGVRRRDLRTMAAPLSGIGTMTDFPLMAYDAACAALAEAASIDEVKAIRDVAEAMRAYARQAKNHSAEADAVAIRMRATRRLAQLIEAQKQAVGLATGAEHGGRARKIDGLRATPSIIRPTLAMQGIDKNLAKQARTLGALSDDDFEAVVDDACAKVNRAVRNAVREVEIEQERESYRARTEQGGTVADLEALVASGFRAAVICPDFPWEFEVYSGKGKQRSAERHYDTWPLERILAMAPVIKQLAADDCVFMPWTVWPEHPGALELIRACGFEYKSAAFVWVKVYPNVTSVPLDGKGLFWGMGYGTRANTETVLLAIRGEPRRLSADVHQVVIAPVGEHSEKPDEVYRRIRRLYPGPYLELFARKLRPNWMCWGDELPPPVAPNAASDEDGD